MSTRTNIFLATRHLREVWNRGNVQAVEQTCTPDLVFHDSVGPPIVDRDAYKEYVASVRSAFPDLDITIHDLITNGRKVVVRWNFIGTHIGEIRGIAPTGRQVSFSGMTIFYISEGRIKEAWISWDSYGYLRQLGALEARERVASA